MRKLLFLIMVLGINFSLSAAPFYKVRCYDAEGKRVDCESRTKKTAVRKTTKKVAVKKAAPAPVVAEVKPDPNKEAIEALRLETETLKAEMEALRKANLIAAAKEEEKLQEAQLAQTTEVEVPAPAPVVEEPKVEAVMKVAKEEEKPNKLSFGFNIYNEAAATDNTPVANSFEVDINYQIAEKVAMTLEQPFNLTINDTETGSNKFGLGDLVLIINFPLFKNDKITIDSNAYLFFPVSKTSRANKRYIGFTYRPRIRKDFSNKKTYVRIEPEIRFAYQAYTSSAPTVNDYNDFNESNSVIGPDGLFYEKTITPNEKFAINLKTKIVHSFTSSFALEANAKITNSRLYSIATGSTTLQSLTNTGLWKSSLAFEFPKFNFALSDNINWELFMRTAGALSSFKPFSNDGNNALSFISYLQISI